MKRDNTQRELLMMRVISLLPGIMRSSLCVFSLFICLALGAEHQEPRASQRAKRQFFVSTTTSSTTLTTQSLCYVKFQAASFMSVCSVSGRKKRSLKFLEDKVEAHDEAIVASPSKREEDNVEEKENIDIESGDIEMLERNKRFLNYWLTITKTTTLTSYTTTSSVGSIICTPYGQSFGPCAGN